MAKIKKEQSIWSQRFRPTKIDDVIFQNEGQEAQFREYIRTQDIPNLLLCGVQGTGKTTISQVLINELSIDPADVLRINCSDEKIDALRNKVVGFSSTMPFGNFKVVQLEEFDNMGQDAMMLLRSLIEDTSATCRYIATCNYENKIMPALKSRFQQFTFKAPIKERICERILMILDEMQIQFEIDEVATYIDVGYPDIRKTIQLIQGNCRNGVLCPPSDAAVSDDWRFSLLEYLKAGDFKKARNLVCSSASRDEYEGIFTFLYQNVNNMKVKSTESAIDVIAEFMIKHTQSCNVEINMAALFINLGRC